MSTVLDQFLAAIAEAGLTPPEFITTDGKLHRFSSDGRRCDKAGWYIFHTGDIPAGAFGCWRGGVSETWRADIGRELTANEIAAHKRRLADAKRKQVEEEKSGEGPHTGGENLGKRGWPRKESALTGCAFIAASLLSRSATPRVCCIACNSSRLTAPKIISSAAG